MELNTIKPADGAKKNKRRLGRGIGSGLGKTAGRGHKGQKSRAGGFHKIGFEGGQMPMHRRPPKRGFVSLTKTDTAHVRLYELAAVGVDEIDLLVLKQAGVIGASAKTAKVYLVGEIGKPVKLRGIAVTKGARAAIEAAGGYTAVSVIIAIVLGWIVDLVVAGVIGTAALTGAAVGSMHVTGSGGDNVSIDSNSAL